MFIFKLKHVKSPEEIQKFLPLHFRYLDAHYETREFLCSGRTVPPGGGIILRSVPTREAAEALMVQDPFYTEGISEYEIIEFEATKALEDFRTLLQQEAK